MPIANSILKYFFGFILILGGLHSPLNSQTIYADSIIKRIEKIGDYNKKIETLQNEIYQINSYKYEESLEIANYGLQLTHGRDDYENEGEFLRIVGGIYVKKGNIDSATVYYYKSLDLSSKKENSVLIGRIYDDLARMYRKLEQSERALEFYNKALELYEAINDREGIARISNESGIVFQMLGDFDEAGRRFLKSLTIQKERGDSVGIGYALEFMGQNQMYLKDYKKAEEYLKEALEIRLQLPDKFALMLSYTSLGELNKELHKLESSNSFFKKSNELALEINFLDIQQHNYAQIEDNYRLLGDYHAAYENLKKHQIIKDSIYGIEKLKAVEDISTKYETTKKEKKILEQRTEIVERDLKLQKSKFTIFGISFIGLLLGIIAYLYINRQRYKHDKFKRDVEHKEVLLALKASKDLQEERLRISRDLHDNIGAQLTFIISAIENLIFGLRKENSTIKDKLQSIKKFTSGTIGELRDTIWAMNLTSIGMEDLRSRITNFIEKAKLFQKDINFIFEVDSTVNNEIKLSNLQGLNVYRIIQESTNNAIKYAEATEIKIEIIEENGILFKIRDNGKGFDEKEIEEGNGLHNMRRRTEELNDSLIIESANGKGTLISFKIKK